MSRRTSPEGVIREFQALSKRTPLGDEERARAKEIMIILRLAGYTNREISDFAGGVWKESTVKLYTRGARVADKSFKTDSTKLLTQFVEEDLTIEDLRSFLVVKAVLDSKEVTFEDSTDLINRANQAKLALKDLIALYQGMISSALTFDQIKDALDLKSQMGQEGLQLEGLRKILQASKTLGGYNRVLDAIATYGSQRAIDGEVGRLTSEKERLEQLLQGLKKDVGDLEKKKTSTKSELDVHRKVRALGFDEQTLRKLEECSDKYGGPGPVLEAVSTYIGLAHLKEETAALDKERADFEAKRRKSEADYAHLLAVIDMCSTLLYKRKFSVQAIMDVYALAERYGEPLTVIRAVDKYGEIVAMQSDLEKLTLKRSELEVRVKELEKRVNDLTAQTDAIRSSVKPALETLSSSVTTAIGNVQKASLDAIHKVETTAEDKIIDVAKKFEDYSNRLGLLKAEAGKLEKEVEMGRIIWAALTDPAAVAEFPLDWIRTLVISAHLFCQKKNYNPSVNAPMDIANKPNSHLTYFSNAGVADLLHWASIGFPQPPLGGLS